MMLTRALQFLVIVLYASVMVRLALDWWRR